MRRLNILGLLLLYACNSPQKANNEPTKDTFLQVTEPAPVLPTSEKVITVPEKVYYYVVITVNKARTYDAANDVFINYRTINYISDIHEQPWESFERETWLRLCNKMERQIKTISNPYPFEIIDRVCKKYNDYETATDSLRMEKDTETLFE